MKANFKYEPGQKLKAPSGLVAPIFACAATKEGNQYLIRTDYAEEWVTEDEAELVK